MAAACRRSIVNSATGTPPSQKPFSKTRAKGFVLAVLRYEEGTIMMKSLFAGAVVCALLAFGGSACAFTHHASHKHQIKIADGARAEGERADGGRQGYPTQFRIPAHPLVWDCVHVVFPQCSRGFDGLNDGSYR